MNEQDQIEKRWEGLRKMLEGFTGDALKGLGEAMCVELLLISESAPAKFPQDLHNALKEQYGCYIDKDQGGLSPADAEKFINNPLLLATAERHRQLRQQQNPSEIVLPSSFQESSPEGHHLVPVAKLVEHPFNSEIFEEHSDEDEALMLDIELRGQLEPIVVTSRYVVISGHRRLRALRALGRTNALIVVVQINSDEEEEIILAYNLQRHMNNVEKMRVFSRYLSIEEKRAAARQAAGKELPENFPEGCKGDARDIAAKNVRLSGRSAERGLRVLQAIDAHRGSATPREIKAVTDAFNKSFLAGEKAAIRHSWIPEGSSRKKQSEPTSEALETAISAASASVENIPAAKRLLKSSLRTVRKVVGVIADERKIKALRRYAQSLMILADQLETHNPPA